MAASPEQIVSCREVPRLARTPPLSRLVRATSGGAVAESERSPRSGVVKRCGRLVAQCLRGPLGGCERTYGPRVARLLARAEQDPDFASACLANFPAPLRERFAALLSKRCFLPGADTHERPGLRAARPRDDAKWLRTAN